MSLSYLSLPREDLLIHFLQLPFGLLIPISILHDSLGLFRALWTRPSLAGRLSTCHDITIILPLVPATTRIAPIKPNVVDCDYHYLKSRAQAFILGGPETGLSSQDASKTRLQGFRGGYILWDCEADRYVALLSQKCRNRRLTESHSRTSVKQLLA